MLSVGTGAFVVSSCAYHSMRDLTLAMSMECCEEKEEDESQEERRENEVYMLSQTSGGGREERKARVCKFILGCS